MNPLNCTHLDYISKETHIKPPSRPFYKLKCPKSLKVTHPNHRILPENYFRCSTDMKQAHHSSSEKCIFYLESVSESRKQKLPLSISDSTELISHLSLTSKQEEKKPTRAAVGCSFQQTWNLEAKKKQKPVHEFSIRTKAEAARTPPRRRGHLVSPGVVKAFVWFSKFSRTSSVVVTGSEPPLNFDIFLAQKFFRFEFPKLGFFSPDDFQLRDGSKSHIKPLTGYAGMFWFEFFMMPRSW